MNTSSDHYIDGKWITGSGLPFMSTNPANQDILWEGKHAIENEIQMASTAAHQALRSWANLDFTTRAQYTQRFSQIVETRREELTLLIAKETGKPLWEAATEVSTIIGKINISIKAYQERTPEQEIPHAEATSHLRYKPHGVIAILGPFNFPAHLSNGHIVPALLAGNTIIYKPSELTPAVAAFIMQCWHDSKLPPGVLNCIQGGPDCAKRLLDEDIQGVYFTGSYRAGVQINQRFSDRPGIILALEMGGNNPLIIDEVSDMKAAIYHSILSTFITAGQRCTCARRLLVPKNGKGDEFLQQFIEASTRLRVGSYTENPEPFMGPVIRHEHALSHLKAQESLIEAGGDCLKPMRLLLDKTGLLTPGIIDMTNVKHPDDEEIFAPLVQVYRYGDFEEALALANQTKYGLVAGLLSDNKLNYNKFYETVRAGLINWNRPTTGASSQLPFGGIGRSGNHRPSAYFAADYCAYPIASLEENTLTLPSSTLPGILL